LPSKIRIVGRTFRTENKGPFRPLRVRVQVPAAPTGASRTSRESMLTKLLGGEKGWRLVRVRVRVRARVRVWLGLYRTRVGVGVRVRVGLRARRSRLERQW